MAGGALRQVAGREVKSTQRQAAIDRAHEWVTMEALAYINRADPNWIEPANIPPPRQLPWRDEKSSQ